MWYIVVLVVSFFIGLWINKSNLRMCHKFGYDETDIHWVRPYVMGVITAVAEVLLLFHEGMGVEFLLHSFLVIWLIRIAAVDHDTLMTPLRWDVELGVVGIGASFLLPLPYAAFSSFSENGSVIASLFGGLALFSFFWLVRIVSKWIMGTEALGFADVTVMAATGVWLGWQGGVTILFVACLVSGPYMLIRNAFLGVVTGELPFVPPLALGAFVAVLMHPVQNSDGLHMFFPALDWFIALSVLNLIILLYLQKMHKNKLRLCEVLVSGKIRQSHLKNTQRTRKWEGVYSGRGELQNKVWRQEF